MNGTPPAGSPPVFLLSPRRLLANFAHSDLASVVALLSGAFSLPRLLLARILRERLALSQACAAGVILGGVALLAVAQ